MPRFERRVDKHGFPIPSQIDDLPGRDAQRDAEQFGNVSFGSSRKREFSASGQRWKRRIIWLGIITVVVGLLLSSFAQPLWEVYADIRTQMGQRCYDAGDYTAACDHFDAALSADPGQLDARFFRGQTYYALQDLNAAHADLTVLIDSKNRHRKLSALYTRALIYYRQQRAPEAMRDADEAVSMQRDEPSARNGRAYLCALLGQDLKKGLDDIDFALSCDLSDFQRAMYLDTRGYLLFKQGELDKALVDLDRGIKICEVFYNERAQEKRRPNPGRGFNQTREEFEADYRRLRESLGVMYHHRGEVYETLERLEEAAQQKSLGVEYGYNPAEGVF